MFEQQGGQIPCQSLAAISPARTPDLVLVLRLLASSADQNPLQLEECGLSAESDRLPDPKGHHCRRNSRSDNESCQTCLSTQLRRIRASLLVLCGFREQTEPRSWRVGNRSRQRSRLSLSRAGKMQQSYPKATPHSSPGFHREVRHTC